MSEETDEGGGFLRQYGLKIVLALVVIYCVWYIWDWLGCSGGNTLCGTLTNLLGDTGQLVLGMLKGCQVQKNCKPISDKKKCDGTATCQWYDGTGNDKAYCQNTTGNKVGQGGLLSPHCTLGMGFLAYGIISALASLGVFERIRRRAFGDKKTAKDLQEQGDALGETAEQAGENAREAKKGLGEENKDRIRSVTDDAIANAEKQGLSPTEVANAAEVNAARAASIAAYEKTCKMNGATAENVKQAQDTYREAMKNINEGPGKNVPETDEVKEERQRVEDEHPLPEPIPE